MHRPGSLGTAILQGLLTTSNPTNKLAVIRATVGSKASVDALGETLRGMASRISSPVEKNVYHDENTLVAQDSDVIILACPPDKMSTILMEDGMPNALHEKLLISVLAGVTSKSIHGAISIRSPTGPSGCYVVRAMPNLAVAQHASATAIEIPVPDFPVEKFNLVDSIFQQLGGVVHLPPSLMDAATVMCGSTPAFIALFLDGLIDGAVAAGVPRSKADIMASQVLASTAALMQDGQRASTLRETVCGMPGCTIQASIVLDQGGVRGTAATAMKAAITAAQKLG